MKNLFLSISFLCLFSLKNFAQTSVRYYFKNTGVRVTNIDSSDYTRVISTNQNNEGNYEIREFYKNQTLKKTGNSLHKNLNPKYTGKVISYYPNGGKQAEEDYDNGGLYGICYYYFENGTLKEHISYTNEDSKSIIKTIQKGDSTGHKFLDNNSSGKFKIVSKNGDIEEGEFLNADKHGIWKTYNAKLNENYTDEYKTGNYIKGETKSADGNIITYDVLVKLPEFPGGTQGFTRFINTSLRYPPSARERGESGRVVIWFKVLKEGTLSDFKVNKGVSAALDEEALRVLKSSPKWIPGQQRGRNVAVSFTVPITFQLAK